MICSDYCKKSYKYSILAGCDKTFPTCRSKFNNTVNFRGEPYIPGFYIV
ncbi:phage BR0599 family protein [Wolbachia endosymbiont of Drosophila bicornuta]|nr:phage BR0599 family protein [Wolbachia endosymbiont of Drosophila bicornuta]MDE5056044.1 phage BR0599 family protein [Wolbachia endosymbiont of Drosophila bicornuta]